MNSVWVGSRLRALAAAARGELTPRIRTRFPLERAADAHRELEGRRSVGAIVLTG
jgi:NADPH2:quinone reductase